MKIYLAGQNGAHDIQSMIIYLAGGVSGNLKPAWKAMSNVSTNGFVEALINEGFLAGGESRHWIHDEASHKKENMKLYMADSGKLREAYCEDATIKHRPYILESFYYADADTERLLPYFGDFLLDSGAFTFMQNSKSHVDWDEYIKRYADFIVRNNIQKYFELDIDSVVGYKKVLEYRAKLEELTNRLCIPVWHKSRGINEFKKMCDDYPYAAIGGIVSKEIKSDQYKVFPSMIKESHSRGCKLHGLGFTSLEWLQKCHFDSVDSTAWTTGNRFGFIYHFNGKTMEKIDCPKGKRLADSRKVALINYTEWIKFQKYAEVNL